MMQDQVLKQEYAPVPQAKRLYLNTKWHLIVMLQFPFSKGNGVCLLCNLTIHLFFFYFFFPKADVLFS